MLNLSKAFLASNEMILCFFFLSFCWYSGLYRQIFRYWANPAYLGWSLLGHCGLFLMQFWILFVCLLSIFASIFVSEIGLYFSILAASLCGLVIRVTVVEFGDASSVPIPWNHLKTFGISTFSKFWYNSVLKSSGPVLFVDGKLLMAISISLGL